MYTLPSFILYELEAQGYSSSITKLVILQKRAMRIIHRKEYRFHIDPLFKSSHILKITDMYLLQVSLYNSHTSHTYWRVRETSPTRQRFDSFFELMKSAVISRKASLLS